MPLQHPVRLRGVILRQILGYSLVIIGIVGLFLPFLQGILMLVTGMLILSRDLPFVRRMLNAISRRFPRIAPFVARAEKDVVEFTEGLDGNWPKLIHHPLLLILSIVALLSMLVAISRIVGLW